MQGEKENVPLAECAAASPNHMCIRLGRRQAQVRFPKSRPDAPGPSVCLLCAASHVLCKRCHAPAKVDPNMTKGEKYHLTSGGRRALCPECIGTGYNLKNTQTYECRTPTCGFKGGVQKFDSASAYNSGRGEARMKPLCSKCRDASNAKTKKRKSGT